MPDVCARGSTVGLTAQLEDYFFKQLETRRKNDGKACPGEEVCQITGPLRDKSRPIEAICSGCNLLRTKPGLQPGHLSALIVEALRLNELKEGGATFAYPDALSPLQWVCIQALVNARRRDQENDYQTRRSNQAQNAETARLQARLNRG